MSRGLFRGPLLEKREKWRTPSYFGSVLKKADPFYFTVKVAHPPYDNMGRLIGTSTQYTFLPGHNFQNSYTYDVASNRTSLTAPDNSINTYQYDALNRLATLTNSLTGQFGFGYDALSRRTQLTRPNGVNTNYTYDSVSHLQSVLHQAGSTTLDGAGYGYDYAGNRTSKTNYLNGITSNYGYDAIYELLQVTQGGGTTESYSYDAVGNRLSSSGVPTYTYNSSNELTSTSSGGYTYDANGNNLSDASGRSFTWDFENRLTQVVNPGVGTTTFRYDPFGRRIQKSGPLGTTDYLYDWTGLGANVIEEVDSSGNVLARYTQGLGTDEPLSMLRAGTTSYYNADALGSITSLSNSSAAIANTYTYDSFGKLSASTGTLANPFQYTGRDYDVETGARYYRARHYDPNIGRFISEDPIRFEGDGPNFYLYAGENPITNTDPFGMDYWVEGSVKGEGGYPFHESVCVGKYEGARNCISFGVAEDNCIFGCKGEVYRDTSAPGPLRGGRYTYKYRYTDAATDALISAEFDAMVGTPGPYWLLGNNCVDFSERMYEYLVQKYHGKVRQKP